MARKMKTDDDFCRKFNCNLISCLKDRSAKTDSPFLRFASILLLKKEESMKSVNTFV